MAVSAQVKHGGSESMRQQRCTCSPQKVYIHTKCNSCKAVQSANPLLHVCVNTDAYTYHSTYTYVHAHTQANGTASVHAHIPVHRHVFIYTTGCISPATAGCISPWPPGVPAHHRLYQPRHAGIDSCVCSPHMSMSIHVYMYT